MKNTDELKPAKEDLRESKDLKIGFDWEPKKKEIKEGMLVSFASKHIKGKTFLGVISKIDHGYIYVFYSGRNKYPIAITEKRILESWDIIIHEPQEENLSVAQDQANFAHAAVQGIINAHAVKLEEDILKEMDKSEQFTFSDFDMSVKRTWKKQDFKDAVTNAALGLTGEAGEVADLIKKGIYHGRGFDTPKWVTPVTYKRVAKEDVKDELSDVLYYISAMAQEFGFTLEDVARHNKDKLEKRFPEGFSTEASAQKKDKHSAPKSFLNI